MQRPSLLRAAVGVSVAQLDPSNDELRAPTFCRKTRTRSARRAIRPAENVIVHRVSVLDLLPRGKSNVGLCFLLFQVETRVNSKDLIWSSCESCLPSACQTALRAHCSKRSLCFCCGYFQNRLDLKNKFSAMMRDGAEPRLFGCFYGKPSVGPVYVMSSTLFLFAPHQPLSLFSKVEVKSVM